MGKYNYFKYCNYNISVLYTVDRGLLTSMLIPFMGLEIFRDVRGVRCVWYMTFDLADMPNQHRPRPDQPVAELLSAWQQIVEIFESGDISQ